MAYIHVCTSSNSANCEPLDSYPGIQPPPDQQPKDIWVYMLDHNAAQLLSYRIGDLPTTDTYRTRKTETDILLAPRQGDINSNKIPFTPVKNVTHENAMSGKKSHTSVPLLSTFEFESLRSLRSATFQVIGIGGLEVDR
jgi:hypothetical protein